MPKTTITIHPYHSNAGDLFYDTILSNDEFAFTRIKQVSGAALVVEGVGIISDGREYDISSLSTIKISGGVGSISVTALTSTVEIW